MSFIKAFSEFINEGVIPVDSYNGYFAQAEELVGSDAGAQEIAATLNAAFEADNVRFVTYAKMSKLVGKAGMPELPPPPMFVPCSLLMAIGDGRLDALYLVYDERQLVRDFSQPRSFSAFVREANKMIRHEKVHQGQLSRMKDNGYVQHEREEEIDPHRDEKGYLSNKQEMMAMARTIVDELTERGLTPTEIKRVVQTGKPGASFMLDKYFKLLSPGSEERMRFIKYLMAYVTMG